MTPRDIEIIRSGFKALAQDADGFETEFYTLLFSRAAGLRAVFTAERRQEAGKLVAMLAVALNSLDRAQTIRGVMQGLARRNVALGLKPGHYAVVGQALLDTLAARLGPSFTDEVSEAWRDVYVAFSEAMLAARYNAIHLAA